MTVDRPVGGVTVVGGPTTLDVGESDTTTFTGSYQITQADIDAGHFSNTAKADSEQVRRRTKTTKTSICRRTRRSRSSRPGRG